MLLTALMLVLSAQPDDAVCDDEDDCRSACTGGDLTQCQALADLIVADERAEAMKLYERACSKGLMRSCSKLAFRLEESSSTNRADHTRALKLTEQACTANDALGCANLAAWLWDEGPAHFVRAAAAAKKGCELGDLFSCGTLGSMYKDGVGLAKDPQKALSFMMQGCEAGYSSTCTALGVGLIEGSLGKVDLKKAYKLFVEACEADYAAGCFQLSGALRRGLGTRRDRRQAQLYLDQACELGMAEACPGEDDSGEAPAADLEDAQ